MELSTSKIGRLDEARAYWARYFTVSWEAIEPIRSNPPEYHWETVDAAGLQAAALRNINVIATIKYTPSWAQKLPPYACGPIRQDAFDEFAQFLTALVSRYSMPPYNIKYWEIGNEIDVDPSLVNPHSVFGCWGDQNDPYYGGGYYASMLQQAYPAIKNADPGARLLIGGLLLDCDPTYPPPTPGGTCLPSKFLEGILRHGGAQYFDIVSYHGYATYAPDHPNGPIIDETHPGWNERGGVIMGKINYLRAVMNAYQTNKPIMLTETSLVCPSWSTFCNPPGNDFYETQADYVVSLYIRTWAANVSATIWYALDNESWRYCSLLNGSTPKPVFNAYTFMTQELEEAFIVAPVTVFPGITGYEFVSNGKRIWVIWSTDRQNHSITLPANTLQVFDKYGHTVTTSGQVVVNSPIYVEISP